MKRIAIIGAGISGLICAKSLSPHFEVTIFEKDDHIAGRMSSAELANVSFDHGAQYFTARNSETEQLLEQWQKLGIAELWDAKIVVLENQLVSSPDTEISRYVGTPQMSSIAEHLSQELNVQTGVTIQTVQNRKHWYLQENPKTEYGPFDSLICTTVPEQASKLLNLKSERPIAATIQQAKMNPCWATLIHFDEQIPLEYDAAFVNGSALRWIARNNSKPGRDSSKECWVLHSEQNWSLQNLDSSPEKVTEQLLVSFHEATQIPFQKISAATSMLWQYSIPAEPLEEQHFYDESLQLGICGDWCCGARVEGAILSGLSLAKKFLDLK